MIDRCFNPTCKRLLQYLRDGRVVRVIRGKGDNTSVEHYWLCGPCYQDYDFVFSPDGIVRMDPKSHEENRLVAFHHDVVLPDRRSAKRAPGVSREASRSASSR
jgi:hypothetical protein